MKASRRRAAAAGRPHEPGPVSSGASLSRGADRSTKRVRECEADVRTVLRHRTVDTLSRMLEATTISPEMYEAGRSFQTDFALAALDPIRARSMVLPVGGGGVWEITDQHLDARRRVHAAMEALGGIDSPAGSAVWHILGCDCSIREWAIGRGWSGQPLRQEQAMGMLIAALGVLARTAGTTPSERPNW